MVCDITFQLRNKISNQSHLLDVITKEIKIQNEKKGSLMKEIELVDEELKSIIKMNKAKKGVYILDMQINVVKQYYEELIEQLDSETTTSKSRYDYLLKLNIIRDKMIRYYDQYSAKLRARIKLQESLTQIYKIKLNYKENYKFMLETNKDISNERAKCLKEYYMFGQNDQLEETVANLINCKNRKLNSTTVEIECLEKKLASLENRNNSIKSNYDKIYPI